MHVQQLSLLDFRSYPEASLELGQGVTVITGPNGSGKTNLVEAIGYAATLRSHRTAVDAPLVRSGALRAVIRVGVGQGHRTSLVELEIVPGRSNRARLNRSPVPRARDVRGHLRRVLFSPEDLSLVKGDPGHRRDLLDELLVALAPRFDAVLSDLERVVRQRNALLRSAPRQTGSRSLGDLEFSLSVWDERLVPVAAELALARSELIDRLRAPLRRRYQDVAPSDSDIGLAIGYISGVPGTVAQDTESERERVRAALAMRRPEELARGVTLVGPHRDEVGLKLNGLPVRGYASQGESWSLSLALRLASFDLLRDSVHATGDAVLVLDDVFSELDDQRRSRLADAVSDVEQVIVTAAAPGDVPPRLSGGAHWISTSEVTVPR